MFITGKIFEAVLISLIITIVCVPPGIWLARRAKLMDYPGAEPHKDHSKPTPMAGGIILVLALVISGTISGIWNDVDVLSTFIAALAIFAFGLWDDLSKLRPILKLMGQILGAVILIRFGVFVQIFESPEFFISLPESIARGLDIFVTILWLVGMTNAFNFIDSMDGLAVGIGGVAAGFFVLFSLDSGQVGLVTFSALLVAMCMGLYYFNSHPARLFLGDAGAQVLGFWLASLAIVFNPQDVNQMSSWFATVLLLGVPVFDMVLVVVSRLHHRQPIYSSARDHTYHRLRKLGLDPNKAVLLMHIAAVVLGCLAVIALNQPPIFANTIFATVVLISLGLIIFLEISFKAESE
jgi:UDP-GlcNAc:undecaprenyl-phosphate GlcNAc-1-phosphate transferase